MLSPTQPPHILCLSVCQHPLCNIPHTYLYLPGLKLQPLLLVMPLSPRLKSPKMSLFQCYHLCSAIIASRKIKGTSQSLFYIPQWQCFFRSISFHSSYLHSSLTSLSVFPLPAQRPFLCLLWPLGEELSWLKRGAWCEDIRSAYGPANLMSNTGDAFVHVWASHCTSWQDNDCWLASKLTSPLAWSACTRHISFCDWVLIYKDFHSLPCSNYLSIKIS